jgi:hypothetical protein
VQPEGEQLYREREQAWWNEHVPGHAWRDAYSQTPRW